jgi:hypothetical protein
MPGRLLVNFDKEIMQLIRETKYMQRFHVPVPESAMMVLLQEVGGHVPTAEAACLHMLITCVRYVDHSHCGTFRCCGIPKGCGILSSSSRACSQHASAVLLLSCRRSTSSTTPTSSTWCTSMRESLAACR